MSITYIQSGEYRPYKDTLNYVPKNRTVTYPKISVGDTVFAIDWIQAPFKVEDRGVCLYSGDKKLDIGLFKSHSEREPRPLYIFMPETSKTETAPRLQPSYTRTGDISRNRFMVLDGYYDKINDCIVLTGEIDILAHRSNLTYNVLHKQEYGVSYAVSMFSDDSPLINASDLKLEEGEGIHTYPSSQDTVHRMIIQLEGCAEIEQTEPLKVGEFITETCKEKLLESEPEYPPSTRGDEYVRICKKIFRYIESKLRGIDYYVFKDVPVRRTTFGTTENVKHSYEINFYAERELKMRLFFSEGNVRILNDRYHVVEVYDAPLDAICYVMSLLMAKYPHMNSTPPENMKNFPGCAEDTVEHVSTFGVMSRPFSKRF